METWEGICCVNATAARRRLPLLCLGILGIGAVFASRGPSPPPLEKLDPAFMHAVTASLPQRDVKAILAAQHSSAPVDLQLYTSCDEEERCTILTTMEFAQSEPDAPSISLRVAVHVEPDPAGSPRTMASSWQVQKSDSAGTAHAMYAGDFTNLNALFSTGNDKAIASLLSSIQSAIGRVLRANGIVTQPGVAKQVWLTNYGIKPAGSSLASLP